MTLPLEFVLDGPAVSQQSNNQGLLDDWKDRVRRAAAQVWPPGDSPVTGPVMVTIIYFYESRRMDVDNIPKPIVDALNEFVFEDDTQMTDLVCRKRHIAMEPEIASDSDIFVESVYGGEEFTYIRVEDADLLEVSA